MRQYSEESIKHKFKGDYCLVVFSNEQGGYSIHHPVRNKFLDKVIDLLRSPNTLDACYVGINKQIAEEITAEIMQVEHETNNCKYIKSEESVLDDLDNLLVNGN
ncbi:hypothetical protein HOK51_08615 [Candidatus Woesearchaeota archaeon]|jgi:hypothetical protein|nr:hypothetical protein [Candidatus Woesearchaeota archaeon]MBT6519889.1 hypothetical protein [Candidatus Woesearchaeota archaeon]